MIISSQPNCTVSPLPYPTSKKRDFVACDDSTHSLDGEDLLSLLSISNDDDVKKEDASCNFPKWPRLSSTIPSTTIDPTRNTSPVELQGLKGPSYEYVNAMRAQELNMMTPKEREKVYDEIHGCSNDIESPDMIQQALIDLQQAIDKIIIKRAYNHAKLLNPAYSRDRSLRIMALRAERFDIAKAARRFVEHFEVKKELWGLERLARPILQSDLDEDDRAALETGYFQVLSKKDSAGRLISVLAQQYHRTGEPVAVKFRVAWYLMMKAMEDDENAQRKGFVGIVYNVGVTKPRDYRLREQLHLGSKFVNSILAKYVSFHYCYDNVRLQPGLAILQFSLGKDARMRFCGHCGSHLECHYNLLSYGIPVDALPVGPDGMLRTEELHKRLLILAVNDAKRSIEMESSAVICPAVNDVLLGRGKSFTSYSGNFALARIINEKRGEYSAAKKGAKTHCAIGIVKHVKHVLGGRFLRLNEREEWEEVSIEVAKHKVTHALRRT